MNWIIKDWTGKRLFPEYSFDTSEDAWEFIRKQFPDEKDWEEMFTEQEMT